MSYSVACGCGQRLTVTASEAGATKTCPCGRAVPVPSLRRLREDAGEAATHTPELIVGQMLRAGVLPGDGGCAVCNAPTADRVLIQTVCEQSASRASGVMGWVTTVAGL